MKRIVPGIVLLFLSTLCSVAQTKNITVTGIVIESESKEPAVQATVRLLTLPDSTYVAGAATLAKGNFTLPKVAAGKYVLQFTYVGFQPKFVPIQLNATNPSRNIGTISLDSDAIMLQEAIITAEAPPVRVVADTTEYAASAYRVPEGSMLEELVKKLPGAEVSDDGTIKVNGKEIKKIMVDGKEFFTDDPKVAMKNLPVSMVEKVKAYDKKSDMARITGIDDGDEETVLDLTVKKGMKQGWIGNMIAGAGNKDRYEAGGMLSRFQDDTSLSIIGSLNNTNNQGFSEFGDAGQGLNRGGRAGSGITSTKSLGVNFAKDTKKLQVGGNIQYGYSNNDARSETSTERFASGEHIDESNSSIRKRHDARADFRLEWRPDTLTTIIFRPNASYSSTNSSNESWRETLDSNLAGVNDKKEASSNKSNNFSLNGRLEAFRRLNNKGRNMSIRASFGYSDGETDSYSNSTTNFYNYATDSVLKIDRYTDRNSDSRNWSVSGSYTEPVFKNHFLQLRYEFAHRKRLSESLVYDNLALDPTVYVDSLSSRVENFYDTHSIDASIRGVHPKMMYSAGITFTPQSSRSETTVGPNASKQLPTQNVTNFAPQIMFRYMFNRQHILMLRYRGRSSEPDIESLQQVIDQSDPLNIRYGNPNLKPSFSHNIMMFYNNYLPESMRSYSANLFFSSTQNSVADKVTYQDNGGKISEKTNINGNWNMRGYFSFNTPLKNRKFTISSNSNIQYSDAVSYNSIGKSDSQLNTTHNLLLGENLRGNFRMDNFDISLNGSINYNVARNKLLENSNRETFDYIFGGSTNITLPWSIYLSTDANYRIKSGYSGNFNQNEIIWNAQVSKNILKNKATIRFKIYDILKEQSNLSRSISNSEMSDNVYNTLGSYFMVHFVYRLNTLGGKAQSRSRQFGRDGGPGGFRGRGGHPGGGPSGDSYF